MSCLRKLWPPTKLWPDKMPALPPPLLILPTFPALHLNPSASSESGHPRANMPVVPVAAKGSILQVAIVPSPFICLSSFSNPCPLRRVANQSARPVKVAKDDAILTSSSPTVSGSQFLLVSCISIPLKDQKSPRTHLLPPSFSSKL